VPEADCCARISGAAPTSVVVSSARSKPQSCRTSACSTSQLLSRSPPTTPTGRPFRSQMTSTTGFAITAPSVLE
jgi:hypothetical protein